MAGETISLQAVQDWLRTHLLNTSPPASSAKVSDVLGQNVFWDRPPADAAYPFGLLRLSGLRNPGAYNSERVQGALELSLITRPAGVAEVTALNLAGDLAQGAFLQAGVGDSAATTSGLIFVREGVRDALPPPIDAVDEQTYQLRIVWVVTFWPRYLTKYAHP